ncbi:MAG: S26 family signal peptidase [Candidatus Thermoplasmatota archaeon]
MEKTKKRKYGIKELIKDIVIVSISFGIFFLLLYAYTGIFPPMVIVESESMMHGDDSQIGVIDTGDITLVKKVDSKSDIVSYVEGKKNGYKTYGDYGDVIIYYKNGKREYTPVIHRVIMWVEYNSTTGNGDIPDIKEYNKETYTLHDFGYRKVNLTINLNSIFAKMSEKHGGFITKGDHNIGVDQESLSVGRGGKTVEPILVKWVLGRAVGEVPWFGLIKLYASGMVDGHKAPKTSVNSLMIAITIIIVIAIIQELVPRFMKKRKKNEGSTNSS